MCSSTAARFVVDETGNRTVDAAVQRVLAGDQLDRTDGHALIAQPTEDLLAAADRVRSAVRDETVDTCSIVNAKAGQCPEDCGFCAQSAYADSEMASHELLAPEEILQAARRAERDGAQRFGIVIAGRGVSPDRQPDEWQTILEAIELLRAETNLAIDASLGILTEAAAEQLAAAGVDHYNHNIETAPEFFPEVVTTHQVEDRIRTLEVAKEAGMKLCAGVILGMGESPSERVDAALTLRDVGITSLPVNILNPVPGTPLAQQLAGTPAVTVDAILKTVAVYRLLLPDVRIRLTGGREAQLERADQRRALDAGVDGLLTGDYLTTDGQSPAADLRLIAAADRRPNMAEHTFDIEAITE